MEIIVEQCFSAEYLEKTCVKINSNPKSCNIFYIYKKHYDKIRESNLEFSVAAK